MAGTTPRLAVGTPYEDLGSATDAGMVQRFDFHNVATDNALTQASPGAAGDVHDDSRYGSPVVALEGVPERVWLIGNPSTRPAPCTSSTSPAASPPAPGCPGSGGVPGGAARFGWSAGGHDDLG